jgi:hypothetical protein
LWWFLVISVLELDWTVQYHLVCIVLRYTQSYDVYPRMYLISLNTNKNSSNVSWASPCLINDYFSKNKPVKTPVIFYHPQSSRFSSQTSIVKRGSSIFFSGSLSSLDGEFYLKLYNFTFITKSPNKTREHRESRGLTLRAKLQLPPLRKSPWLNPFTTNPEPNSSRLRRSKLNVRATP